MPQFDVDAALKDGNSLSDIAGFLSDTHGFDYNKARADGVTDQGIVDFLSIREVAPKPEETTDKLGAIGDVGRFVADIPTQVKGAIGNLATGDETIGTDTRSERWAKEGEDLTKRRKAELEATGSAGKRVFEDIPITRGDIVDASGSSGFSLVAGAPAAIGEAGRVASKFIPNPIVKAAGAGLGVVAGMAASGGAAYEMDKNMFTRQLLEKADADLVRDRGFGMDQEERQAFLYTTEDLRQQHGLWEAGPEAVGNAIGMFGLGKIISGVAGGNVGKAVAGYVIDQLGEHTTETITGQGQHNVEIDAGLEAGQKRDWNAEGLTESFKEQAPQTTVLGTVMGGGAAGVGQGIKSVRNFGKQEDVVDQSPAVNPEPYDPQMDAGYQARDFSILPPTEQDFAGRPGFESPNPAGPLSRAAAFAPVVTPAELAQSGISGQVNPPADVVTVQAPTGETQPVDVANPTDIPAEQAPVEPPVEQLQPDMDKVSFTLQAIKEADSEALEEMAANMPAFLSANPEYKQFSQAFRQEFYSRRRELANQKQPQPLPQAGGINGPANEQVDGTGNGIQVERADRETESGRAEGSVNASIDPLYAAAKQYADEIGVTPSPGELVHLFDIDIDDADALHERLKAEGAESTPAPTEPAPVDVAAHEAATSPLNDKPEPTEAMTKAGNYAKGHTTLHGLNISIENPAGSTREGRDASGKPWKTTMRDHYGYIKGTVGKDKDHLDVFIPEGFVPTDRDKIAVIDQIDPATGKLDEHKIIFGSQGEQAAKTTYLRNYDSTGKDRIGAITMMPVADFKNWLATGDTTKAVGKISVSKPPKNESQADLSSTGEQQVKENAKKFNNDKTKLKEPAQEPTIKKGEIGEKLAPGEVVLTSSGRQTTPFPNGNLDTNRKLINLTKKIDAWLHENAVAEARARGDNFNLRQFENEDPKKMPPATKDSMEMYLFGEQPKVVPSILKDMVVREPSNQQTTGATGKKNTDGHQLDGQAVTVNADTSPQVPTKPATNRIANVADQEENQDVTIDKTGVKTGVKSDQKTQPTPPTPENQQTTESVGAKPTDKDSLSVQDSRTDQKNEQEAPAPPADFAGNTIFTSDKVAAARARLAAKRNTLSSGFDPEMLADIFTIGGAHFEAGIRSFSKWSKAVLADIGPEFQQYIQGVYENLRHVPNLNKEGMNTPAFVEEYLKEKKILDDIDKGAEIKGKEKTTSDGGKNVSTGGDIVSQEEQTGGTEPAGVGGQDGGVPGRSGAKLQRPGKSDNRTDDEKSSGRPDRKSEGAQHGADDSQGSDDERPERVPSQLVATNYRITDADRLGKGGAKQKARDNIKAIRILKQLRQENRPATPEEQSSLVKYVGWGASELANGIFPKKGYDPESRRYVDRYKDDWKSLGEELRALLTDDEYAAAKGSTLNAHYTHEKIIRGMYSALEKFGYSGKGRILEPGSGVGHFVGLMPESFVAGTRFTTVEMDHVSAGIAKALYPGHDIRHADFTKFKAPDNFFDVAIGNPPFADIEIVNDLDYAEKKFKLHDYFFAKSIDKVRPGGLMILVTIRYTMDKGNDKARSYLSKRADLLGAIRLPQTAFKENAGTEVVTDVLFLRKRMEGEKPAGQAWGKLSPVKAGDKEFHVNEYFANHPEMVLGKHSSAGSMYGPGQYTVEPNPGDISEHFAKASENLPADIYQQDKSAPTPTDQETIEAEWSPGKVKEGAFYLNNKGILRQKENGMGVTVVGQAKKLAVVKSFVKVRDAVREVLYVQLKGEGDLASAQEGLAQAYDAFVKEHGPINKSTEVTITSKKTGKESTSYRYPNFSHFKNDPDAYLVAAIEKHDPITGKAEKADIFTKRVISPTAEPKVESLVDALHVSLHQAGEVDIPRIAGLMGVDEATTIEGLSGAIYFDPNGTKWVTADEYLSGNVRRKLAAAKAAAEIDPKYAKNVEALEGVQPEDLPPSRIKISLGMPIITANDVEAFAAEVMQMGIRVRHIKESGSWDVVKNSGYATFVATDDFGTNRMDAADLIDIALNNRTIKIYDRDVDGKQIFNRDATEAAFSKLQKIKERFSQWVWEDQERSAALARKFNDLYNNTIKREYGGDHIKLMRFPGMSSMITPHEHQKRVAWRIVQRGNTYMAHSVGAGKTIGSIIAGMELKRLGIKKKPMWVVPNHMLKQFSSEFQQLYPAAKLLVADEEQFSKENRNRFMGRIAAENWDGIIITHSAFGKIPVSEEYQSQFIGEQIDELEELMIDASGDRTKTKQLERQKKRLEQRLEKILSNASKDKGVSFEDSGIDQLFIDEAHEFRKLDFVTNQTSISGIDPNGSLMAFDLYVKSRYLESLYPGRSLVMMSGTPVTNTIGEVYTIQRFLSEQALRELGIHHFDGWASTFGESVTELVATPAGTYQPKTRFGRFRNMPSLAAMWGEIGDFVQAKDLPYLKRPAVEGGGRNIVIGESSEIQKAYKKSLSARLQAIKNRKGPPQKGDDITLTVITDGRHAALDDRFIASSAAPRKDAKLEMMVDQVHDIWRKTKEQRSTQMIFADLGLPQAVATRGFSVYTHIREELVRRGVPEKEIAFMQEYKKSDEKQKLFRAMNKGDVRVLIGSSEAMGTGVNAQSKMVALHHFDPDTYLPSNIEQREGRIVRQGNENEKVQLFVYVTRGSYDETMWQFIESKQRFIDQFLAGSVSEDTVEDIDGAANQYAEARAMSSDNPLVLELAGLDNEISKLESLRRGHIDAQHKLARDKSYAKSRVETLEKLVPVAEKAIAARKDTGGKNFFMKIDGEELTERKDAGKELVSMLKLQDKQPVVVDNRTVGTLGGFTIKAHSNRLDPRELVFSVWHGKVQLDGKVEARYPSVAIENGLAEEPSATGLVMRLENIIKGIDERLNDVKKEIAQRRHIIAEADNRIGAKFEHADALETKRSRADEIRAQLEREGSDKPVDTGSEAGLAGAATDGAPPDINSPEVKRSANEKTNEQAGNTQAEIEAQGFKVKESQRVFTGDLEQILPGNLRIIPWSLPNSSLAINKRGKIDLGRLPKSNYENAERISRIFGKQIIWATIGDNFENHGVMVTGNEDLKNKVFIDVRTPHPAHVVLGHELLHHLKQDHPAIYDDLYQATEGLFTGTKEYRDKYPHLEGKEDAAVHEEILGDILGDSFASPALWRDVAAQAGGKKFRQIANRISTWINSVIQKLKGAVGFNAQPYVSDLVRVRTVLAKATAQYADAQGKGGAVSGELEPAFSKPSPQFKQVDVESDNFKKWFKDSKVVDENGKPLVVNGLYVKSDTPPPKKPRGYKTGKSLREKIEKDGRNVESATSVDMLNYGWDIDPDTMQSWYKLQGPYSDPEESGETEFFLHGLYGLDEPNLVIGRRRGAIDFSKKSKNHASGEYEHGVSVINLLTAENQFDEKRYDVTLFDKRNVWVWGYALDNDEFYGSDGEVLLANAEVLSDANIPSVKSAISNTGEFSDTNPNIRFSVAQTDPVSLENLEAVATDMAKAAKKGSIKFIKSDKKDSSFLERLLSTPEYYFKKTSAAAGRVLQAALLRRDVRFQKQKEILGDFVSFVQDLRKTDMPAYQEANEYLIDTDQVGGFSIKETEDGWVVMSRDGKKEVSTHPTDKEAQVALVEAEANDLKSQGYADKAIDTVKMARALTNRAFDVMAEDMRRIIQEAADNGRPNPFIGDGKINEAGRYGVYAKGKKKPIALFRTEQEAKESLAKIAEFVSHSVVSAKGDVKYFSSALKAKKWAARRGGNFEMTKRFANLSVKKRTDEEMRPMTVKEALAQMGDLRGSYFPRIRENGEYVLIARKDGENPFRQNFDLPGVGDGNRLQAILNSVTPIGRKAKELKAQGYDVTISRDTKPTDDVFDATGLITSIDALLEESMGSVNKNDSGEVKAAQVVDQILTMQIADIFKARGYLASRMKRLDGDEVWEGYETDMGKALTQYGKSIAAGTAKRDTARAMVLAFTGRDYSWQDYKDDVENPSWEEYKKIVEQRRIDPGKQKNLFKDVRAFIVDVLRNDEQTDRIVGTLKGLAVHKFLGFRISSAAVNATNMVTGVVGTMSGITGEPISQSLRRVMASATAYTKYRSGVGDLSDDDRAIFLEISNRGWDEAQFDHEAMSELRGKMGDAWNKYEAWSMFMFGAVEKANRAMTIFAALKAVKAKHPTMEDALQWDMAKEVSDKAHGTYGKETLPAMARGGDMNRMLRMPLTFTKFTHNYMLNIIDLGFNKKEWKAAAYLLLSPAIIAGSGATIAAPAVFALAGALGIGGDDPEEEFYQWAADTFGSDAFARHGLAGLVGVNIKGSLAINLPMPSDLSRLKVADLFGPVGGIVSDVAKGAASLAQGDVAKGVELLLPTAFGSMSKAARESSEGITTSNYGSVFYGDEPLKANELDAVLRFFSLNPSRISGIREKQWNEKEVAAKYQERKTAIYHDIKRDHLQGNGLTPEILKEIKRYNELVDGSGRGDISKITPKSIRAMLKRNSKPGKVERGRQL